MYPPSSTGGATGECLRPLTTGVKIHVVLKGLPKISEVYPDSRPKKAQKSSFNIQKNGSREKLENEGLKSG